MSAPYDLGIEVGDAITRALDRTLSSALLKSLVLSAIHEEIALLKRQKEEERHADQEA